MTGNPDLMAALARSLGATPAVDLREGDTIRLPDTRASAVINTKNVGEVTVCLRVDLAQDSCARCNHSRREHYRDAPMGNGCWHTVFGSDCSCSGFETKHRTVILDQDAKVTVTKEAVR